MKTYDFYELSALHKAILAAKFGTFPNPQYAEITASPILAGISNSVYDEMCRLQEKKMKGAGQEWQDWRRVKDTHTHAYRGQWRIAVMAARRSGFFSSLSHEHKITSAKAYLSPFTCTEAELDKFIDSVDHRDDSQSLESLFSGNSFKGAMLLDCSYNSLVGGGDARMVLGMKKGKNCDIFFGGVQSYNISHEGNTAGEDGLLMLDKYTVKSGNTEKFDAVFSAGSCSTHIVIESKTVDYWL